MATRISLDEQISCVKREVSMRKRVYPRWVAQEKMAQEVADKQIAAMEAVLETLEERRSELEAKTNPPLL